MEEVSHYEKYKSVENRVSSTYEALEVCETGVREGTTATSNANNVDTNSNPSHLKKRFCCGITAAAVAVTIIALAVMLAVLKSKGGSCTSETQIKNSKVVEKTGAEHGDTRTIECEEGHKLVGPAVITCLSSNQWSDYPECIPKHCDLFDAPNFDTTETDFNLTQVGTNLTLKCKDGFILEGVDSVICQNNKTWSSLPTCDPVDCGLPNNVTNDGNYCTENACLHGECVDGIGHYSCSCYPGFEGTHCEKYTNNCMSNPCIHGHCFNGLDTYRCLCYQGYTGQSCDININECLTNPCKNGNCTDEINGYNCSCLAGYTGTNCEHYIDACSPNPCQHGTCTDDIHNYNCTCFVGFYGSNCEKNLSL